jgi:hypothetical protein
MSDRPIQRIILPNKKGVSKTPYTFGKTPKIQSIEPIKSLPNSGILGFETGSIYQCVKSFESHFTKFEENEILEVIGTRKPAKSKDLEIIFSNVETRQKKFWTLPENEKELAKLLFIKLE